MAESISELFDDAKVWLRQKLCRHKAPLRYEELKTESHDGKLRWSAFHECSKCGEILSVEASYFGGRRQLMEALEKEEGV